MLCPFCNSQRDKVVNSRPSPSGDSIRRRRECLDCSKRFTTVEMIEKVPVMVVKREGRREPFDRQKIINGVLRACEKRKVPLEEIEKVASYVERTIQNKMDKEVQAKEIGELILNRLKGMDEVAYVRFASVYRDFRDVSEFNAEVQELLKKY